MPRLFIAIDLPETVRDPLADLYEAIHGAKWTDENQLHLTLRFIGDVDNVTAEKIDTALRPIKFEPFELQLKSVGIFPLRGDPRILWCGVSASEELMTLRARIERVLTADVKLPHDAKKFHPHVTLARLANPNKERLANFVIANTLFQSQKFEVSEFNLYSSVLKREGALHILENQYGADHQ